MDNAQRSGRWICLAVLAFILIQGAGWAVSSLVRVPQGHEERLRAQSLSVLGITILGVVSLYSALWKGLPASRWLGFMVLVFMGVFLIWFAYWQTTWDFPNASSADARARMQEDCRAAWPWTTAWGTVNLAVAALLLLPQVGQFLRARRENKGPNEELHRTAGA